MLQRLFQLEERQTTCRREFRGAIATFLTMAYILGANPAILSQAGVPLESAVACTALAAGICCILMGLIANFPIALASGMGLNAVVALTITKELGSWQAAMGLVVLDGILVAILVLAGVREAVLHAIPVDLRRAIGAGIGLFIAFIGFVNAGVIIHGQEPGPPVAPGSLADPRTALAIIGVVVTAALLVRSVTGALLIGIVVTSAAAWGSDALFGTQVAGKWPTTLSPPSFEIAFQADILAVLKWQAAPLLLSLVMVDFFDTLGTVTALADQTQLQDREHRIPRLRSILLVDSASAAVGGLLGVSSVTSYIESAAGIAEGARTGLHSVFVGLMFLGCILLAPLAGLIPLAATAPALIAVGFLMSAQMTKVDLNRPDTAIPAFITLVMIPFTFSIAHGIGYGFLSYVAIKLLTGRVRELHWIMAAAAGLFLAYFVWAEKSP
jgi:AGZA family xanthine/uracil permease-like MFS transporter